MKESGYYPTGAEHDPNAPWNKEDQKPIQVKVTISQSLSRLTTIEVTDYIAKEYTDAEYDEFVKFASGREFDQRSTAEIEFEKVLKSAQEEALYNHYKSEFDALQSKLKNSKEQVLRLLKEEVKPVIEQEIVAKYYYTFGRMASIIKSDKLLQQAIEKF